MATKKAAAKKAAPKQETPKKETPKQMGRPPKLGEVTERKAADAFGVDTGVIVRAMVKKAASDLCRVGPIGTRMALRKFL